MRFERFLDPKQIIWGRQKIIVEEYDNVVIGKHPFECLVALDGGTLLSKNIGPLEAPPPCRAERGVESGAETTTMSGKRLCCSRYESSLRSSGFRP